MSLLTRSITVSVSCKVNGRTRRAQAGENDPTIEVEVPPTEAADYGYAAEGPRVAMREEALRDWSAYFTEAADALREAHRLKGRAQEIAK